MRAAERFQAGWGSEKYGLYMKKIQVVATKKLIKFALSHVNICGLYIFKRDAFQKSHHETNFRIRKATSFLT